MWEKNGEVRSGFSIWVPQIINRAVTGIVTAVYLLLCWGSLAYECSSEEWPYKYKNAFLTKFTIKHNLKYYWDIHYFKHNNKGGGGEP